MQKCIMMSRPFSWWMKFSLVLGKAYLRPHPFIKCTVEWNVPFKPYGALFSIVHLMNGWSLRYTLSLILFTQKLARKYILSCLKHEISYAVLAGHDAKTWQGCAPLFFTKTGAHPLIFAETGHLTVCRHPGATAFLLKKCLQPPIENPLDLPGSQSKLCRN